MISTKIEQQKPESTIKIGKYLIFSTGRIYDSRSGAFLFPTTKDNMIGYVLGGNFISVESVKNLFE